MVNEAIDFLKANEPPEGYSLAFSGGKDSIVTKYIADLAGVKYEAHYSCTGIDPPEVVKFIKMYHPEVRFLYPKKSFYQLIREKMPPSINARWCCDELKKKPSKEIKFKTHIVGIRKEESFKRSQRPRIDKMKYMKVTSVKPIFNFLEWHIWELIENYNLPYPILYDEGFDRIGCVVCPMICSKNLRKIDQHKDRWPGIYKAFEHAVDWWFYNKAQHNDNFTTSRQYLQWWYMGMPKQARQSKVGFYTKNIRDSI